jgi:hypothetical protein
VISKSAEAVFKKKRERRRQLAKLPFEKKIEIIVELQKAAAGVHKEKARLIWPIERRGISGGAVLIRGRQ